MWSRFEQRFGVRLLRSGLGQSECLLVLTQLEDLTDVPVYALGFAQPDIDIRLFDDEGVEVADGEVGEICVKPLTPHILLNGHFDCPDATACAYRGEWYMEFVDSLPYTPTNKVQKFKLRETGVSASCWDITQSDFQLVR